MRRQDWEGGIWKVEDDGFYFLSIHKDINELMIIKILVNFSSINVVLCFQNSTFIVIQGATVGYLNIVFFFLFTIQPEDSTSRSGMY